MITETGVSRRLGQEVNLCDQQRVEFYRDYINNVLMSVRIDEVKLHVRYLAFIVQYSTIDLLCIFAKKARGLTYLITNQS